MNTFKNHRYSIEYIKDRFKDKELTGIEIGVHAGNNSLWILNTLNIKKMYLIDPWHGYHNLPLERTQAIYEEAMNKLKPHKNKLQVIQMKSNDACDKIEDLSVDFCYIDGDHTSRGVHNDIKNYYPKVKVGGILAGHDYNKIAVKSIVDRFAIRKDVKINHKINKENRDISDWWFVK